MRGARDEGERLRRAIAERVSKRGRLPEGVREEAKAYVRARVARGATQAAIALELGLTTITIQRWLAKAAASGSALLPVRVVDVRRAQATQAPVVVTTPSGLRIDGLDLDALCTLVSRCG